MTKQLHFIGGLRIDASREGTQRRKLPSRPTYLENLGIHGIQDTGGKILETGGIFGEHQKNLKI
jgi:hypothetical protein